MIIKVTFYKKLNTISAYAFNAAMNGNKYFRWTKKLNEDYFKCSLHINTRVFQEGIEWIFQWSRFQKENIQSSTLFYSFYSCIEFSTWYYSLSSPVMSQNSKCCLEHPLSTCLLSLKRLCIKEYFLESEEVREYLYTWRLVENTCNLVKISGKSFSSKGLDVALGFWEWTSINIWCELFLSLLVLYLIY